MPEHRLRRTRESLPSGYQFGLGAVPELLQRRWICRHEIAMTDNDGTFCMNCGVDVDATNRRVVTLKHSR